MILEDGNPSSPCAGVRTWPSRTPMSGLNGAQSELFLVPKGLRHAMFSPNGR